MSTIELTRSAALQCDWADEFCGGDESWRNVCAGCRRPLRICEAHYGYHVAYQVLGPACPTCGTRDVATSCPDVPDVSA